MLLGIMMGVSVPTSCLGCQGSAGLVNVAVLRGAVSLAPVQLVQCVVVVDNAYIITAGIRRRQPQCSDGHCTLLGHAQVTKLAEHTTPAHTLPQCCCLLIGLTCSALRHFAVIAVLQASWCCWTSSSPGCSPGVPESSSSAR